MDIHGPITVNPDSQIAACCRAIVRTCWARGLLAQAKLPTQDELSSTLGFCHNTLTPAMNLLVDAGMLLRRRRVGTIMVNPHAVPAGLWRVAIPYATFDGKARHQFATILCHYLQEHLQKRGCVVRHYLRKAAHAEEIPHALDHFGQLAVDVAGGKLDAILTPAFFSAASSQVAAAHGVSLCHVGSWQETPLRVVLDTDDLLLRGVRHLHAAGCRRIGLLYQENLTTVIRTLLQTFRQALAAHDSAAAGDLLPAADTLIDGAAIASRLLATPADQRPDGIIVLDDVLASGFAAALNRTAYSPALVVQTNRQIPLFFPLPTTRFEYNIDRLAARGADLVEQRLFRPGLADEVVCLAATLTPARPPVAHASQAAPIVV